MTTTREDRKVFDYPTGEVRAAGILLWRRAMAAQAKSGRPGVEFYVVEEGPPEVDQIFLSDPGGKADITDTSILETARREFFEEAHVSPPDDWEGAKELYIPEAKYLLYLVPAPIGYPYAGGAGRWVSRAELATRRAPRLGAALHAILTACSD
jgi:hypothetical protein